MKELIDLKFKPLKYDAALRHATQYISYPGNVSAVFKHAVYKDFCQNYLPTLTTHEYEYDRVARKSIPILLEKSYFEYYSKKSKYGDPDRTVKVFNYYEWTSGLLIGPVSHEAKGYNEWINNIAIGDFVKCKGQRNSRVWKKIIDITDTDITCMQYTQPIDDIQYFDGYSSSNNIYTIKEKFVK